MSGDRGKPGNKRQNRREGRAPRNIRCCAATLKCTLNLEPREVIGDIPQTSLGQCWEEAMLPWLEIMLVEEERREKVNIFLER